MESTKSSHVDGHTDKKARTVGNETVDRNYDAQTNGTRSAETNGDAQAKCGSGTTNGSSSEFNVSDHYKLMPIAIIGMSCRLSGDVSSLDDFWEMLTRARCGWSEIPEDRFSKDAYYHPNPAKQGAFNTIGGYFLKQDPALFDAAFFNITQAEAEAMGMYKPVLLPARYQSILKCRKIPSRGSSSSALMRPLRMPVSLRTASLARK